MKRTSYIFPIFLLTFFYAFTNMALMQDVYAKDVIKTPIKAACPECQTLANELAEARYQRDRMAQIVKNWKNRLKQLSKKFGSQESVQKAYDKAYKAKNYDKARDIEITLKAFKQAQTKLKQFQRALAKMKAYAIKMAGRLKACEDEYCKKKGKKKPKKHVSLGGFGLTQPLSVTNNCPPCDPIAKKINKLYREIFRNQRALKKLQMNYQTMLSQSNGIEYLKRERGRLLTKLTKASGSEAAELQEKMDKYSDRIGEMQEMQEEMSILKSGIKDDQKEVNDLLKKLIACVEKYCGDKPKKHSFMPGFDPSPDTGHASAGGNMGTYGYASATMNVNNDQINIEHDDNVENSVDTNNTAVGGELLVGVGHNFNGTFFTAVEIFGNLSGTPAHKVRFGEQTIRSMGIHSNYGIAVVPGAKVAANTCVYAKIGAVAGRLEVNVKEGDNVHTTLAGLQMGVGVEQHLGSGIAVRGELTRTNYRKDVRANKALGIRETFRPSTNTAKVGLVVRLFG